ncbi:nuclear transport factor 2 family protein [Streptomyces sp. A30]|uniref:nuclear transport factor 2 family protein n=1 Tax=Streptomyces sp. A30 TaxID=2789273 RepID=UPI00397EA373
MTDQAAVTGVAGTEEVEQAEEVAETARAFIDAMNRRDLAKVAGLFTEDATWTVCVADLPGAGTNRASAVVEQMVPGLLDVFESGPELEILRTAVQGDWVAVEAVGRGRLRDGREYRNQYTHWYRIEGGRVAALREYMDSHYAATVFFGEGR